MANYEELKRAVKQVIKPNGVQEITGEILQNVLVKMIDTFGDEYKCKGVAVTSTTPQVSGKTLYFASTPGVYSNFAGLSVAKGEIVAFAYDGTNWTKTVLVDASNFATLDLINEYNATADNAGRRFELPEAISAIPAERRKPGMFLKFIKSDTGKYILYYNTSEQWSNKPAEWEPLSAVEIIAEVVKSYTELADKVDDTIQIHNASPNGEVKRLETILSELEEKGENVFKNRLAVSFIEEKFGKRAVYFCKTNTFSNNVDDWSKTPAGGASGGVSLLPFNAIVRNVIVSLSTAIEGEIVYDEVKRHFLCVADGNYCVAWIEQETYGTPSNKGVEPKEGVIYYLPNGSAYTWKGGNMVQLSTGGGSDLPEFVQQKINEIVEHAKQINKGEKGNPGEKGEPGYFKLVNHGTNDTTFALTPNTMHVWGEVPRLTLTLAPNTDTRFVAEYAFQFTCPAAIGTELSLPSSLQWIGNVFKPQKGQTYQAYVINGFFVMGGTR